MPSDYGDPAGEYRALVEGRAVLDMTSRGAIRVTGADRAAFLQGLITNDMRRLAPGGELYACHTDQRGHVVSDLWIHDRGDHFILEAEPGLESVLRASLECFRVIEEVEFRDVTGEMAFLRVVGREPGEWIAKEIEAVGWFARREGPMGFITDARVPAAGAEALFRRLGASGLAIPVGLTAWESLRIERGVPRGGAELDGEILPLEACLDSAVSYAKGCYLGQEAIAKMHYRGKPRQVLAKFEISAMPEGPAGAQATAQRVVPEFPAPPIPLFSPAAAPRPVGRMTSVAESFESGRQIGLGFVWRELAAAGARFEVGSPAIAYAVVDRVLSRGPEFPQRPISHPR